MGKKRQRPFNPGSLRKFADPAIAPRIGTDAPVSRFMIVVPVEQIRPSKRPKATPEDLELLEKVLIRDFGGITVLPPTPGYGLRDPQRPESRPEMNYNTSFVVYAAPIRESVSYFQALRRELEDALQEGVILIEEQEVFIV